jgi:3'-5' exoribonuclease
MPRLPSASAINANSEGWGFFLCTDKSLRTGRGGDYLALTLADATGALVARVFDNVDRLKEEFDVGEFVKVQGRANLFNGRLQFIVEAIRRVMTGPDSQDRRDGFREDALVPSSPRPIDEMWRELQQVVAAVRHPHLNALLTHIVTEHEAALRLWPAARAVHHAYRGGFLEHVLTMSEAGRMLALLYGADADLVVTGAILHDIGKLQELEYETTTTYSRDGNMIGHITLGAIIVHDACKAIPGFPDALRTEVLHMIASHHGERALGSPVEPMSIEAFILSAVDDLDATINQIRRAIREDDGSGEFTNYQPRLGRVLWKGPQA